MASTDCYESSMGFASTCSTKNWSSHFLCYLSSESQLFDSLDQSICFYLFSVEVYCLLHCSRWHPSFPVSATLQTAESIENSAKIYRRHLHLQVSFLLSPDSKSNESTMTNSSTKCCFCAASRWCPQARAEQGHSAVNQSFAVRPFGC